MSEPEVSVDPSANGAADDVEMAGDEAAGADENGETMGGLEDIETEIPEVQSFTEYVIMPSSSAVAHALTPRQLPQVTNSRDQCQRR